MEAALSAEDLHQRDASRLADRDGVADRDRNRLADQDREIERAVEHEGSRLRGFIRRRVGDPGEAEDVLQEVFYELVEAYRLMKPIEEMTAWLFRVARNRITDLSRKKKPTPVADLVPRRDEDADAANFEDLLPSPDAGPEAEYARGVLLEELEAAIDELPASQREAFVGHEIEGRSFKELSAETGASVNALVLRKRYAVERLRKRLAAIRAEFAR